MKAILVYLASKSPRRRMLLEAAGFKVEVLEIDCEEEYPAQLQEAEIAVFLARLKMEVALKHYPDLQPLITADTVVSLEGKILEKPQDVPEAQRMLQQLSGRQHTVYTGVTIHHSDRLLAFTSVSQVTMAPLTQQEIDYYIKTAQPFDKAGSYGIQDWIGWTKITRIEGSYANIMGLPVDSVYAEIMGNAGA